MHVKYVLLVVAASGAAFYSIGRHGYEVDLTPPAAVRQAMALGSAPQTPPEVAQAPAPAPTPAPVPPGQKPPAVDESALRYFAAQGDTRRMEAELARLRALYPEWQPPVDLTAPVATGDPELERMWKLFAEGKTGEVRAAIAKRAASEPDWRAPEDLLAQLDAAEAGQRLVNASNARQWEQVIRIGTETPALLTCANVDALWRVAEAFVQTGKPERARDAYAYVLTNCNMPGERVGTMQKALATLPDAMTEAMLAQERESEFSSIRDELARRRIGRAAEDAKLTVSADDLRRVETLANAATTPDDAILLGFYSFHRNDTAKAETWFRTALARNGGAKAAEGAVLAFGANAKYAEAEALGAQWLEAGPANRKAYLDVATSLLTQEPPPKLERVVVERIAKTVGADRYAPAAAALGWYAYNAGQTTSAESWFETALAWDPGYEPAAYGLALSRQRLRDRAGLRQIMADWGRRSERIATLLDPRRPARNLRDDEMRLPRPDETERVTSRETPRERVEPVRQSLRAEAEPQATERNVGASRSLGGCNAGMSGAAALQRGWCLLNLKRPAAAADAFEAALRSGNAQVAADAAAGKAYAKLQQGLTAEASAAASQANVSQARRDELSAVLLSERFYAQYDARDFTGALVSLNERARFAPETTDLMLMRGWSYFNLGRYDDASTVFTALYRANGSAQAMSGLTAIRDITQRNRY